MADRSRPPGRRRGARVTIWSTLLCAALVLSATRGIDAQGILEGFRRSIQAQSAFRDAKTLYDARDYQRARDRFIETLGLDPDHDEARALLGWSQYFLGDYRAAIISFKTALKRQPDWDGLYNGLGWSRFRLGRFHLATEAFRAALEKNPESDDALIGLGSAQFELGAYDAALPSLETALKRLEPLAGPEPPELPGVRAKVAWSLYYLGRHREALAQFQKGIRRQPQMHGLYSGAGWCYLKLGQKAEARSAFERALALKPDYEDAREGLRQTAG